MFIGTHYHSLDSRNRLAVPKKFREELGKEAVVTRGLDGCLFLYSKGNWLEIQEKLSKTPLTKADARSFSRLILSGAVEVEADKIGRILLPGFLKDSVEIKTEVAVLGVGERIEVWAKERWETYRQKLEEEKDSVAERLSELGI
ncbi:division/cell wall cluster transcriptional repressor MraZ [Candidatus Shapirobacteria bacterium]|nr:division/cell wall cluster transcriptional repressor MraZ [Candidatus Shapirobacteria bacterium]